MFLAEFRKLAAAFRESPWQLGLFRKRSGTEKPSDEVLQYVSAIDAEAVIFDVIGEAQIEEQASNAAYLVARGVRALALLDANCAPDLHPAALEMLAAQGCKGAIPFVTAKGAMGYVSHPWALELFNFCMDEKIGVRRNEILGLLLGYSAESIQRFRTDWDAAKKHD